MKAPYFTQDSIDRESHDLQEGLAKVLPPRPFWFDADKAGLIVLDMQNYFLDDSSHAYIPSAAAVVPRLLDLIEAFQSCDRPVLLTRHQNTSQDSGSLSRWWSDVIERDHPMSELHPLFQETEAPILEKTQYDAFYGTGLEESLREAGVEQLVIGGVMTHLCCETTARSAFVRGFEVFFLVDGTATYNIEFHRSTLLTLSHGFAHPVRVEGIISALDPGKGTVYSEGENDMDGNGSESTGIDIQELKDGWREAS